MTGERRFDTRAVHAGQSPDPATGARAPPLYQTTSYVFEDAETAGELYSLEREGDIYSRISNPTVRTLERRVASLEGGVDAVATASGMAALDAATTLLARAGDNVVSSSAVYGGTRAYLTHTAGRRGIEPRFVESLDPGAFADAADDRTAYVHVETIGNPSLVTPDLAAVAEAAHDAGAPLLVDNTFATPALCRPLEHGADLVWESTTKWLHGSGTTVGGVLVDGGSFPWADHPERFDELADENPAFHGVTFAERFGDRAFAAAARHRAVRPVGHHQKPFDAWQTLQGLETLGLRMTRHCENAAAIAAFLDADDRVDWVTYPGFADHSTHEYARRYLDGGAASDASGASTGPSAGGFGGMVTFGPADGYEAAKTVCERAELASFLANVGDAKTLVVHPASTTHAQLDEDEKREAGVTPDLVRLSVGIEDPADIVADLDTALAAAAGEAP